MFFDSWSGIGRVIVVGAAAYVALVLLLRISGKRTLSKLNAFDLVVTVALGSTLATVLLSKEVALAEGVTAFALLIAFQAVITWLSVRSGRVAHLVKAEPSLLYFDGRYLQEVMKRERVTEDELTASVRQQGVARMHQVLAVVLETDGSMTVITRPGQDGPLDVLEHVQGASSKDAA